MFAALATLFFLADAHEPDLEWVGLAFTCALGCATGLEGALGFCLGCYFFGWGVRLGLLPREVYSVSTNSRPEVRAASAAPRCMCVSLVTEAEEAEGSTQLTGLCC